MQIKSIMLRIVALTLFVTRPTLFGMQPMVILKAGNTEVKVNPKLYPTSSFLETALETYEPEISEQKLPALAAYLAKTWKKGFKARRAEFIVLKPLIVDFDKLIHEVKFDELVLPKFITLWQKAYEAQFDTNKKQAEKEITTALRTMPIEQWIGIAYIVEFLQIKLLYNPLRKTFLDQVINNIGPTLFQGSLLNLALRLPLWDDPLFKAQLIGKCLLFNITHTIPRTLAGHTLWITSLAITPDNSRVITGSQDGTAKIWDLTTGTLLHTLTGHTSEITSLAITPDSSRVITGSEDETAKIWDITTGALLHTLTGHTYLVTTVAITPDGSRAIIGSGDGTVKIWDLGTGALLHTLAGHTLRISSLAITPDSSRAITGSSDSTVKIWDITTGALLHTLTGHTSEITSLAITPDSSRVITGSWNGTAKIWDLTTGALLHTLAGHTKVISSLAITPDSSHVITGSWDETAKIWDLTTGALLHTLAGHTYLVTTVAITPDGSRAITGSHDTTAKIWDLTTGTLLHTLAGHTSGIISLAITPDSSRVITGSWDGTAKIWGKDLSVLNAKQLLALAILIHLKQKNQLKNLPEWLIEEKNALPDDIKAWFKEQKWYNPFSWFR